MHMHADLHDVAGDQGEVRGGVEEPDDGPHGVDEQLHVVAAWGEHGTAWQQGAVREAVGQAGWPT